MAIESVANHAGTRGGLVGVETHPLVAEGHIEIVWNDLMDKPEPGSGERGKPSYYIGVMEGGPGLRQDIASGKLDEFFNEFTMIFRDIFAGPPWNEYLRCRNADCREHVGAEEVFGDEGFSGLDRAEKSRPRAIENAVCPKCGSVGLDMFHSPDQLCARLKEEFSSDVCASFYLDEAGALLGFSYGWFGQPRDLWRRYLKDAVSDGSGKGSMESYFGFSGEEYDARYFIWNEWGVHRSNRNSLGSVRIIDKLLTLARRRSTEFEAPVARVLGTSLSGANALKIFMKLGAEVLYSDEHSNVVVISSELEDSCGRLCRIVDRLSRRKKRIG